MPEFLSEGADKIRIISEAALQADLRYLESFFQEHPRHDEPFFMYILMDGVAGVFFKFSQQVVFADIEPGRQRLQFQFLVKVFIDISDDIAYLVVVNDIEADILVMAVQIRAVQVNQQLGQVSLLKYPAAVTIAEDRILKSVYYIPDHYIKFRPGS